MKRDYYLNLVSYLKFDIITKLDFFVHTIFNRFAAITTITVAAITLTHLANFKVPLIDLMTTENKGISFDTPKHERKTFEQCTVTVQQLYSSFSPSDCICSIVYW